MTREHLVSLVNKLVSEEGFNLVEMNDSDDLATIRSPEGLTYQLHLTKTRGRWAELNLTDLNLNLISEGHSQYVSQWSKLLPNESVPAESVVISIKLGRVSI